MDDQDQEHEAKETHEALDLLKKIEYNTERTAKNSAFFVCLTIISLFAGVLLAYKNLYN